MSDVLPPFPKAKGCRKGHQIDLVFGKGWITQACQVCGFMRRVPQTGPLDTIPLDDLSAEEAARLFGGKA